MWGSCEPLTPRPDTPRATPEGLRAALGTGEAGPQAPGLSAPGAGREENPEPDLPQSRRDSRRQGVCWEDVSGEMPADKAGGFPRRRLGSPGETAGGRWGRGNPLSAWPRFPGEIPRWETGGFLVCSLISIAGACPKRLRGQGQRGRDKTGHGGVRQRGPSVRPSVRPPHLSEAVRLQKHPPVTRPHGLAPWPGSPVRAGSLGGTPRPQQLEPGISAAPGARPAPSRRARPPRLLLWGWRLRPRYPGLTWASPTSPQRALPRPPALPRPRSLAGSTRQPHLDGTSRAFGGVESGSERASRALHPFSLGCILPRSCSLTTTVTLCTPSPAADPPCQGASSSLGEQPVPALVPWHCPTSLAATGSTPGPGPCRMRPQAQPGRPRPEELAGG